MDSGGVGLYPSIAYDSKAGVYGVAYEDPTHGLVKYAYYRRGFRSLVVDSGLKSGRNNDLAGDQSSDAKSRRQLFQCRDHQPRLLKLQPLQYGPRPR